MVHNLYGERALYRGEPAWHGLGLTVDQDWAGSPLDAIKMAHLDYEVGKIPVTVNLPNGDVIATDRVALVRQPTADNDSYAVLGFAGTRYTPLQNIEVAELLSELGKRFPVETVGALGQGETIFLTLKLGRFTVKGRDEVDAYLAVANSHDGKNALKLMIVTIRIVCNNTLVMATNSAIVTTKIPHLSTVRDDAEFHINLLGNVVQANAAVQREYQALANRIVTPEEAYSIFAAAYPDPTPSKKAALARVATQDDEIKKAMENDESLSARLEMQIMKDGDKQATAMERQIALRDEAANLFLKTSEITPEVAVTAWAAWQGVTELESFRGNAKRETTESIIFGDRAANMARGYKAALALL